MELISEKQQRKSVRSKTDSWRRLMESKPTNLYLVIWMREKSEKTQITNIKNAKIGSIDSTNIKR